MFNFCPSCGKTGIVFDGKNRFSCAACGFDYYQNTAAAAGIFINNKNGILFLERAREPALGKLDVPGGFIEPKESILEGLRRECLEELGFDIGEQLSFVTSFPNVYPYKSVIYNTCDMFFSLDAPELRVEDLSLEADEVSAARFIKLSELVTDELAFTSARKAIEFLKCQ